MKKLVYIAFASTLLFACNSSEEEVQVENPVAKVPENEVIAEPNQVATIEVDGMACVMACGGSIKKALRKTHGVSNVEFDFETGRETNIATVAYNSDIVTVDEMKEIISALNNHQFTVGETTTESISNNTTSTNNSSSEEARIEVSTSRFEMPNLLDILSGLLPG